MRANIYITILLIQSQLQLGLRTQLLHASPLGSHLIRGHFFVVVSLRSYMSQLVDSVFDVMFRRRIAPVFQLAMGGLGLTELHFPPMLPDRC